MGSSNVLSEKDANNSLKKNLAGSDKPEIKSMEYHRQVLKSKMEEEKYGRTATPSNTTTTTTTKSNRSNKSTTSTPAAASTATATAAVGASSSSSGLGTATIAAAAAAAEPASASPQMVVIHRTLAGRPANPNALGARSSSQQYVSPSDDIMSPCTAKLNALKGRHAGKAKPKSLFAQASAKKFVGENVLGAKNAELASPLTKPGDDDNQQAD
ncbi:hypothetical protein F4802DRAFT_550513 [Xylaria palmicola]|nr:hypothetical protein F4802DRAFT_550513 [Xylaria palmicola]